jgi:hypothetical protein
VKVEITKVQHAEAIFARIIRVDADGSVLVRRLRDGADVMLEPREARRIVAMPAGSLIEYEWTFAPSTRTNAPMKAKPLAAVLDLPRNRQGAAR